MPKLIRYGIGAGLVVLLLFFFGCHRYKITLLEGYRLVRMNRDLVCIINPVLGNRVVRGNVETYAVSAPFITGYASTNHVNAGTNKVAGYFLVNADSQEVSQGLSEDEWKRELERIQWGKPQLQKVP